MIAHPGHLTIKTLATTGIAPVVALMLDPPRAQGASGGFEMVSKPLSTAIPVWTAQEALSLTLSLALSGPETGAQIASLLRMTGQGSQPPILEISAPGKMLPVPPGGKWLVNSDLDISDQGFDQQGIYKRANVAFTVVRHDRPLTLKAGSRAKPATRLYLVRKGDTWSRIAKRELKKSTRANEIKALNGARGSAPKVGSKIRLPLK